MRETCHTYDSSLTVDELLMYFSTLKIKNQKELQSSLEEITYAVVSTFDVDRCGIWLFDDSKSLLTCKNLYSRKSATYSAGQQIILSAFPSYFEEIKTNRIVAISSARESELTKNFFQKYLEKINVNSILNIGIWDNGDLIGVMTLSDSKNMRQFDREQCLSLVPFADLCASWIGGAIKNPHLQNLNAFNNEGLLNELAYLCRKSESLSTNYLIKKALQSISTLVDGANAHAIVFNQSDSQLHSSNCQNQEYQPNSFQANSLFKIASDSKFLWIPDSSKMTIGLPSLFKKICPNSCSLAIVSSQNAKKNSPLKFVLIIEFSSKLPSKEMLVKSVINQLTMAFAIILEHADTKSVLKESLSLAKGAFDGSNIGMAVFDSEARLIRFNRSIKELVEDDLKIIGSMIPKSLLSANHFKKTENAGSYKGSQTIILPSGEEKHLYIDISSIESSHSSLSFFLLQVLDISKQKKAITELKEQKVMFKSVIDLNPAFIFAKTLNGTFVLANESVSEVYGTTPECLIGMKDSDLNNNPAEVKKFREDDARVILGKKEIFIPEEKITDSKGKIRYLQTVKKPILNPHDGTYLVLGVATDITERKLAEEKERMWLKEIEHTQKLESLGLLAGGIAHDFNNLLQAIVGNGSLSLRELGENSKASGYMEKVLIASDKASALCNQLLCYSKNTPTTKTHFDLNKLIKECSYIFERVISKNVTILYSLDETLPNILGDKTQFEQVVMNLITNAVEAASEGGQEVSIRTRMEEGELELISLQVEDTGLGVPDDIKQKIFDPFFTTKVRGRGLGLSAVQGIIQNHGGTIELLSSSSSGSTFKVSVPYSTEIASAPQQIKIAESNQNTLDGKSIFLIDDDLLSREVSTEMLSISGAKAEAFEGANLALSKVKNKLKQIDAVILDLNMPLMSGEEAFHKIRSYRPKLPILIISGYSDQLKIENLLSNPNTSFLAKPYSYDELILAVSKCLTSNSKKFN